MRATASPTPPPFLADVRTATRLGAAFPDDLPTRLAQLPAADRYLQDAVAVARHPTLVRVWCRRGRRGQRTVQAPGTNDKRDGFGVVDWQTGWFDWDLAEGRRAAPFCDQLRPVVARWRARGRTAIVILDNRSSHTPKGSKRRRALLAELGDHLILVYTPPSDPDSNRIEWRWRALRRAVTHTPPRATLAAWLAAAQAWARDLTPIQILRQIGSPFAELPRTDDQDLAHAA